MENMMKAGDTLHHFKGGIYHVVAVAENSSNSGNKELVCVYSNSQGNLYCRPIKEMEELVDVNGVMLSRFVVE